MLPKQAYYHAFHLIPGCGPVFLQQILAAAGHDIAQAWALFPELIQARTRIDRRNRLIGQWRTIDVAETYERLEKGGISTVTVEQNEYPALLRHIHAPPYILYYRGVLEMPLSLTVVGTRKMTPYGYLAAKTLLTPLARAGIGIISGLAFGIDAACHQIALEEGSYTAAVLGSGLNRVTPSEHVALAERIVKSGGCVISQFLPDMPAREGHFPARNRILAGLTNLSLVIEAASLSGALITARRALAENREVAAVPGSILSDTSNGCNGLLKDGAHMVTSAQDLMALLQQPQYTGVPSMRPRPILPEREMRVYECLSGEPVDAEAISAACKLPLSESLAVLSMLEMAGLIRRFPGRGYCRND